MRIRVRESGRFTRYIESSLPEKPGYQDPGVLYVSELARCLRESFYARRYALPQSMAMAVAAISGSAIHGRIEAVLEELGLSVEVPVEASRGGVTVRGRVDAVGEGYVVEIKTANGDQLLPSYARQAAFYAGLLGYGEAYVVVVNRVTGVIREYHLSFDPGEAVEELWERARRLHNALDSGRPPAPERGPLCRGCIYRIRCMVDRVA